MRIVIVLLMLFTALPLMAGKVFKWVDADGQVHYGEDPSRGKAVDLPGLSTYSAPAVPKAKVADEEEGKDQEETVPEIRSYNSAVIRSPQNDETFFSNEGIVDVVVDTDPLLQEGHTIKVQLDGKFFGTAQTSNAFKLSGVERGTHKMRAGIYDSTGSAKGWTRIVTFHLRQHSVNNLARPQPR